MPTCYILIGVPGSGKSTWIAKQPFDWNNTVIASTDNYVDREATKQGKTYSDIFHATMPHAVKHMAATVQEAVQNGNDIIWDQTSTTRLARAKKFRMLPPNYKVVGVVFRTPEQKELQRRLANRPGKVIPPHIMSGMIKGWEEPTEAEGFDDIIYVNE
jgi:predicted kinase